MEVGRTEISTETQLKKTAAENKRMNYMGAIF